MPASRPLSRPNSFTVREQLPQSSGATIGLIPQYLVSCRVEFHGPTNIFLFTSTDTLYLHAPLNYLPETNSYWFLFAVSPSFTFTGQFSTLLRVKEAVWRRTRWCTALTSVSLHGCNDTFPLWSSLSVFLGLFLQPAAAWLHLRWT